MGPIFYPNGQVPLAGDNLIQRDLAFTLKRISKRGISGFYAGKTATAIASFMAKNNGLITKDDLINYASKERTPIHVEYRGHDIYNMSLPSSGEHFIMAQLLKLIEPYPLTEWGHNSAATMHVLSEAMALAYGRAEWLGDEDMVSVPTKQLLSPSCVETRRQTINQNQHTPSEGITMALLDDETTHYSVVDQWGTLYR